MKKWLIIYAFLIALISLALTGYATPAQKNQTISTAALKAQKGFFVGIKGDQKQKGNGIVLNLRIRTTLSLTVFPAIKEGFYAVTTYRTGGMKLVIAETKMLLYDHLLHLFPSHYFW